jgi:hypothetical protein
LQSGHRREYLNGVMQRKRENERKIERERERKGENREIEY